MDATVPSSTVLSELKVAPKQRPRLHERDTVSIPGLHLTKKTAPEELEPRKEKLALLQQRLYAEGERSLLVVLQGTDTSGKDGAIKNVFAGITPSAYRS
jgi:polyphosphate kinase 2 (PPK2 family)